MNGKIQPYKPVGCLECRMTGYKRGGVWADTGVAVSEGVRHAMHPGIDIHALAQNGGQEGLRPLRLSGGHEEVAEGDHAGRGAAQHASVGNLRIGGQTGGGRKMVPPPPRSDAARVVGHPAHRATEVVFTRLRTPPGPKP